MACIIYSLDNLPLDSVFCSECTFQNVQFLFSFTLSSKGDSGCVCVCVCVCVCLTVSAWNQSHMTQVFLSFILYVGIIMCLHQMFESCNTLRSSRPVTLYVWWQVRQVRLMVSLLCQELPCWRWAVVTCTQISIPGDRPVPGPDSWTDNYYHNKVTSK